TGRGRVRTWPAPSWLPLSYAVAPPRSILAILTTVDQPARFRNLWWIAGTSRRPDQGMADVRAAIAALAAVSVAAFSQPALAASNAAPLRTAVIAEARPEGGRLALIWPTPTTARLILHGAQASLLADRPVEIAPADATTVAPWLIDLSAGRPPEALLL